jgi:hypothetical protein
VAGQTVSLQEGRAVLFDDSFLHEAANSSSSEPRVVLIVDVWHPDLSDEEVGSFSFFFNVFAFLRCFNEGRLDNCMNYACHCTFFNLSHLLSLGQVPGVHQQRASKGRPALEQTAA